MRNGTVLEALQKFHAPQMVGLTKLRVRGSADGAGRAARLGVGVSLNGVDVLAKKMSEGSIGFRALANRGNGEDPCVSSCSDSCHRNSPQMPRHKFIDRFLGRHIRSRPIAAPRPGR